MVQKKEDHLKRVKRKEVKKALKRKEVKKWDTSGKY